MDLSFFEESVIGIPSPSDVASITYYLTTSGDSIPPWGQNWVKRDKELERIALGEPFLKSAIHNISQGRAALQYELDGPPRAVSHSHDVLKHSDFNNGWVSLMMKVAVSILLYDNGAFIEVLRDKPTGNRRPETMPVLALNHLDSLRCFRTGNPEVPVVYMDDDGKLHELKWYQVITLEEAPSPHREHYNRQFSFVTRVLEGAKIMSEISRYKEEKVSGRFNRAIHVIGGVSKHEIDLAKRVAAMDASNAGLLRYMEPIIMASLDPNAKVSHVQIDMATLPDHFDEGLTMQWYITLLAIASGGDYQDLAPLPGGNLGTASQSETLHRKSRVKGTQLWMKLLEHKLHVHNVLPGNVSFRFSAADSAAEAERAQISNLRATTRSIQIASGESTPEIARLQAVDAGDLKQDHLIAVDQATAPTSITVADDEEVIDALTEFSNEPLNPVHAAKAAKWWRHIITHSPLQNVSPISEDKLRVFEQALRNMLTKEVKFGTSEGWMSYILLTAAQESGIHAIALRQRLPDEYVLVVTNKEIKDSTGRVLHRVEPDRQKEVPQEVMCKECGKQPATLSYIPFKGFDKTYCDCCNGKVRIPLASKSLPSVYEAVRVAKNKYFGDTVLAALQAAYELGYGKPVSFNNIAPTLREEIEELAKLKDHRELLVPAITKWYMLGVKKALAG